MILWNQHGVSILISNHSWSKILRTFLKPDMPLEGHVFSFDRWQPRYFVPMNPFHRKLSIFGKILGFRHEIIDGHFLSPKLPGTFFDIEMQFSKTWGFCGESQYHSKLPFQLCIESCQTDTKVLGDSFFRLKRGACFCHHIFNKLLLLTLNVQF